MAALGFPLEDTLESPDVIAVDSGLPKGGVYCCRFAAGDIGGVGDGRTPCIGSVGGGTSSL